MTSGLARKELSEFLRSRRESLSPEQVGLERGRRRRTPGLRREEVAQLAHVGVTWYTWLEQGRKISVAHDTLGRIGRALQFAPTDMAYLFSLAGAAPPHARPAAFHVDKPLRTVLDGMRAPALVLAARLDVLAFNPLADEILAITADPSPLGRNNAWRMFMDPARRRMHVDWAEVSRRTVGVLRAAQAHSLGDPSFQELIDTLRAGSDEFDRLWRERRTAALDTVATRLRHPRHGALTITLVRLTFPAHPNVFLSVLSPANTRTSKIFAALT